MPVRDLVVYTFRALEAWAAAYRFGRDPDQTPFEFADHLVEQAPELSFEVQQITRLYVQIAYGAVTELPPCQSVLELLWSKMTREVLAKSQI